MKKGIVKLFVGITVIVVVVGFVVPRINQASRNPVMQFVNDNELDTGVLFYTESEEGLEATLDLANKKVMVDVRDHQD